MFGEVTEGLELLDQIESLGSSSGKPSKVVKIVNCGRFEDL